MDLYKTLGILKNATTQVIKKAYKRKASIHHPDKNGNPEEFQKIKVAYNVLSNTESRTVYDETGGVPENKPQDLVGERLTGLFSAVVEGEQFNGNIIESVTKIINDRISAMKGDIEKSLNIVVKLSKQVDRIKCEGEDNLFAIILDNKIAMMNNISVQAEKEIDICNQVLKRLEEYSDERPEIQESYFGDLSGLGGLGRQQQNRRY